MANDLKEVEETMKESFDMFDRDGNGTISNKEIMKVMQVLGHSPTEKDIDDLIKKLDKDGNNTLDFNEFKEFMMAYKSQHKDEEAEIVNAFKMFDKDGNGFIEAKELKHILHGIGQTISDEEIEEMIKTADVDADGKINYNVNKTMQNDTILYFDIPLELSRRDDSNGMSQYKASIVIPAIKVQSSEILDPVLSNISL